RRHHRNVSALERRGVVEAAGIAKAARRVQPRLEGHALALDEGRRWSIDGRLQTAGTALAVHVLDVEEQADAVRGVARGLTNNTSAHPGVAGQAQPGDILGRWRQ